VQVAAKRSVLIVDDEFGLAEMLSEMLSEHGYEVSLAINGRLAFDILGERRVDLVITDMMMPIMDGFELAAAMRRSDLHRATPILMMTSLPTREMAQSELFDGVIRKPFTPELLLTTIEACLSKTVRTNGARRRTDRAE
jgi:DNA-binding response OmpR family regulator